MKDGRKRGVARSGFVDGNGVLTEVAEARVVGGGI